MSDIAGRRRTRAARVRVAGAGLVRGLAWLVVAGWRLAPLVSATVLRRVVAYRASARRNIPDFPRLGAL